MAESRLEKYGVTPGKLAVVVILAGILLTVILLPGGETDDAAPAYTGRRLPQRESGVAKADPAAPSQPAATGTKAADGEAVRLGALPGLDAALALDPFALPPALAEAHKAREAGDTENGAAAAELARQRAAALAAIRSGGVQMVLDNGREAVAVLGGRLVRVGDEVEGFRVSTISLQGVTLSEPENPADESRQP